jgi:hypothetical protein
MPLPAPDNDVAMKDRHTLDASANVTDLQHDPLIELAV